MYGENVKQVLGGDGEARHVFDLLRCSLQETELLRVMSCHPWVPWPRPIQLTASQGPLNILALALTSSPHRGGREREYFLCAALGGGSKEGREVRESG